eukprot:CAMPEP_0117448010 /NCGR_PEP_ID=MMETSP0759-20121206/7171_1 /TAXON_ID=63605 /ORGANISM="Percolomonas cosmopolitus, Strain WS" /LENGTH=487 /DNA_ID=CAMNT_0005240365 /DNA_START=85 /DNA_END=1548 /DNA_ORIENTATION=+
MPRNLDTSSADLSQSITNTLSGTSQYAIFTHHKRTPSLIVHKEVSHANGAEWYDAFWTAFLRKDLITYAYLRLDAEAQSSGDDEATRFLCLTHKGDDVGIVFKSKFVFFMKEYGEFMEGKCHQLTEVSPQEKHLDLAQIEKELQDNTQGLFVAADDGRTKRMSVSEAISASRENNFNYSSMRASGTFVPPRLVKKPSEEPVQRVPDLTEGSHANHPQPKTTIQEESPSHQSPLPPPQEEEEKQNTADSHDTEERAKDTDALNQREIEHRACDEVAEHENETLQNEDATEEAQRADEDRKRQQFEEEERAREEEENRQRALEADLRRETELAERLRQEQEEEDDRLRRQAEEDERQLALAAEQKREAEEAERLRQQQEEEERLRKHAEVDALRRQEEAEAEERARLDAEDEARRQKEEDQDNEPHTTNGETILCTGTAQWDFATDDAEELAFEKGDVLNVLRNEGDWLFAELNGKSGFVPSNYVTLNE